MAVPGDNLTNMVIDDDLAVTAANDMVQAAAAAAPFTRSWLPVFNAPWPTPAGFPTDPDAVGNLSRFDGTSTKGTWTVLVSDQFAVDTGTLNSWSMLVTPVHFACSAFAPTAAVTATKTVGGALHVGGTGDLHHRSHQQRDWQPGRQSRQRADGCLARGPDARQRVATSGTATATIGTNTVTWNGSLAPLGGSVTITITATINAGTAGTTISNQGSLSFDADLNGTNEASGVTDDPAVGGASDPTSFNVLPGAFVTGTKSVTGSFLSGGAIVYTIVLSNSGSGAQPDNPGDEFSDVLPTQLALTGASASSGTAVATIATRTVTWNGSIAVGASVTITILATIDPDHEGTTVSNQGSVSFDSTGVGTNDMTRLTDDPAVAGANDPTQFVVLSGSFYTVTPCRLVDTRGPNDPLGGPALVSAQERVFLLEGLCNLPVSATAVALNVTVTITGSEGFVTVWPDGESRPPTSTINFSTGQTRANNAVVKLGSSGAVRAVSSAATHIVIDVTGYFQ